MRCSTRAWRGPKARPSRRLGHFHPKGKAPSKFTLDALKQARGSLPFDDVRDFEEFKKGFIAPMPEPKIMADDGRVAWDMERFRFLETKARIRQHSSFIAAPIQY